jgi:hypothetical protein
MDIRGETCLLMLSRSLMLSHRAISKSEYFAKGVTRLQFGQSGLRSFKSLQVRAIEAAPVVLVACQKVIAVSVSPALNFAAKFRNTRL